MEERATVLMASLREIGAKHGLLAGCAVVVRRLKDNPAYAALVAQQAGIIVEENALKFGPLRPSPTDFYFDDADALFDFAAKHDMKVRGHNFVWHRQIPKWFEGYVTKDNAEQVLVSHIERVGGRYAGRVHSWDVANEVIQIKDGLPGGFRDSPWQKVLGDPGKGPGIVPAYVEIAYRAARRIDPKALLFYNDYGIEGPDPQSDAKRKAVMDLLHAMKARGIPLDGLGVQSHISASKSWGQAETAGLRAMIAEAGAMGLKVMITEMDVNDRDLPTDIPTRDQAVAKTYGDYLHQVLADPCVIGLLTWGISDKYTWLNGEDNRKDGQPERCLPFDADFKPKEAFAAEVQEIGNRK